MLLSNPLSWVALAEIIVNKKSLRENVAREEDPIIAVGYEIVICLK